MDLKRSAGEYAANYVKDGMTIGLGTGSTVYWTIQKLGQLIKGGLSIQAVPTSIGTANLEKQLSIPLMSLSEVDKLDLTIDGADEIDTHLQLIKGGGGALLREKLVATSSEKLIIIADESKLISDLGTFPLPVEIVPFAWEHTVKRVQLLGCKPTLRLQNDKPFITDNGNLILDCVFPERITNPSNTHQRLKAITGVIETGFFIDMVHTAIIGTNEGVKRILPHHNNT
ncbi:ribose 5-phosphate isomerase A [Bacillus sp. DX1.1]|uniref:ribose 5-phosphate isomerase A n=1 Tax=unclassified Bacillus (in: firmicutes) TaxID=185979 RepID=UPI0025702AC2|nr:MULTISPECIES: ribose 5-phosphate isomerase A [unclassified Bacillus (in: firmicutes)]MDM5155179.1 ribose 5-phosphate isomerase A [Bacillus sp. DX1.1]WJE79504.1 ribose 5-phosphate isomerase A [Bacillus sp. DX3.1]